MKLTEIHLAGHDRAFAQGHVFHLVGGFVASRLHLVQRLVNQPDGVRRVDERERQAHDEGKRQLQQRVEFPSCCGLREVLQIEKRAVAVAAVREAGFKQLVAVVQGACLNGLKQGEGGHRHPLPKAVVQVRDELVELTELVALVLVHRQHFALIGRKGLRHTELNFFQLTNALLQVVIHTRFQDEGQIKIVLENICAFKLGHVLGAEKAHPFIAKSVVRFELRLVVVEVRPHSQARAGGLGNAQE